MGNIMLEEINYQRDNEFLLKLNLAITFFIKSSFFDIRDGILDFYSQCLEVIGSNLLWFRTETMGTFKPVTERTFEMIPFWFAPQARRRSFYMMSLKGGKSPWDVSPEGVNLAFLTNSGGQLRLSIPIDYIQQSVEPLLILTKNLSRKIPFTWGQAGFSLSVDELNRGTEVTNRLIALSRRYLGIDIPDSIGSVHYETEGIKCINWLTLLDNSLYQKIAAKAIELRNCNNQIHLHTLDQGGIIQAGAAPSIGDINRGESLPNYRDVGKLVRSLRVKNYRVLLETREETLKWLSRFDQ